MVVLQQLVNRVSLIIVYYTCYYACLGLIMFQHYFVILMRAVV